MHKFVGVLDKCVLRIELLLKAQKDTFFQKPKNNGPVLFKIFLLMISEDKYR